jgi:malate dehydrogenase
VSAQDVHNVIIWGNHSNTQFPDVTHAGVTVGGQEQKVTEAVKDDHWLKNDFISTVQKRGAEVIAARKLSSAMSAAKAICDHLHDWWTGTKPNRWVSMGVTSDGSYGIAQGLIYSFPVQVHPDHSLTIVQGLPIDQFARDKMNATQAELVEERESAETFCSE